jgi:hypothetical protein
MFFTLLQARVLIGRILNILSPPPRRSGEANFFNRFARMTRFAKRLKWSGKELDRVSTMPLNMIDLSGRRPTAGLSTLGTPGMGSQLADPDLFPARRVVKFRYFRITLESHGVLGTSSMRYKFWASGVCAGAKRCVWHL